MPSELPAIYQPASVCLFLVAGERAWRPHDVQVLPLTGH
jgi:hypothetical protein